VTTCRPLEGLFVVSTALNVPGPVALARLTSMGARAVKIEPPGGDPLIRHCREWYDVLHDGIDIDRLDLKTPEGQNRLEDHLSTAAVLITAQRQAALQRLGLHWERLHERFPHLCQVAIVGFSPPRENEPGHDLTYLAAEGLVNPPDVPRTLAVDLVGAERAVSAVFAARAACGGDGAGRCIDVALSDVAHMLAAPLRHGLTAPGAILGGGFPGYRLYRGRHGWLAVAALEPRFLERLRDELHGAELCEDRLAAMFATRTAIECERWGRDHDVPIVSVRGAM